MTATRGAPYFIQIGSAWKHLANVAPGVPITPSRPTSFFTSIGNVIHTQVADIVKRAWAFTFQWEDADATRWLDYAAANPDAEVWLLDANLAKTNMLAVSETKGGSSTLIDVDGLPMPAYLANYDFHVRARAGQTYHLSYTTTAPAGVELGVHHVDGVATPFVAVDGTGARRGSLVMRPTTDSDLHVVWTRANSTTAARLTEGSVDDLGFIESRGATPCQVLVSDGAVNYKMAWESRPPMTDSSYTVTEVG